MSEKLVIVKTGVANTAAVVAAFKRLGKNPLLSNQATDILNASHLVLPGVGAFAAGMKELERNSIASIIKQRAEKNQATLGVCLGLQLFCKSSEEATQVSGLSLISEKINRFSNDLKVPQIGWNKVTPDTGMNFIEEGFGYFANSYRLANKPEGWSVAKSNYGEDFVAAAEKGNILLCQFHPELSGKWGLGILNKWIEETC